MSDVDPTPETPVTIGDRLGWFRGDMQARLDLVVARLDLVVARLDSLLTGGNLDSAPIVSAIEALRGTAPNNTLASLYAMLNAEIGSGEGISLYNIIDAMHTLLTATNNAVGGVPTNSLELATVRGLLNAILYKTAYGILPDTNAGETPTQAGGTVTTGGFRWLTWNSIQDVVISEDNIQLTPDSSWTGYAIYVQSDAPTFDIFDYTTATAETLTSNSWHILDDYDTDTLGFRVAANYAATGYMRVPAVAWETLSSGSAISSYRYINWPATWSATEYNGQRIFLEIASNQRIEIQTANANVLYDATGLAQGMLTPGFVAQIEGPRSNIEVYRAQESGSFVISARLVDA